MRVIKGLWMGDVHGTLILVALEMVLSSLHQDVGCAMVVVAEGGFVLDEREVVVVLALG